MYSLNSRDEGQKARAVDQKLLSLLFYFYFSDLARVSCTERCLPASYHRHLPTDGARDGRVPRQAPQNTY